MIGEGAVEKMKGREWFTMKSRKIRGPQRRAPEAPSPFPQV